MKLQRQCRPSKRLDNKVQEEYTGGAKNVCSRDRSTIRDLGRRDQGGANTDKRAALDATARRRSVIKDAIGKVRAYLSSLANWEKSGRRKGKPGLPGATDHPTLYQGTCELILEEAKGGDRFVRLKVYDGHAWQWVNYPVVCSRYFQQRQRELAWEQQSPTLVLSKQAVALHFPQTKEIAAKKVKESKLDPELVTVAVDLNVKNLVVITVRQHGTIIETVFLTDHGLDQQRYRYLRRIAKKQWLSGKPVKGERSNQQLWRHVRRMNEDATNKVARSIANVCQVSGLCAAL